MMQEGYLRQVPIWLLLATISAVAHSAEKAVPIISEPKDIPSVAYDAGFVKLLVPSVGTEGRMAVLELQEMPGFDTPWHQHDTFDEVFYVLEGTLTLKLEGRTLVLPAGTSIFIPRGTPHAQGNFTQAPVRLLTTFTPGGFEQFFADRAELFKHAKRGSPEFAAGMKNLREKHARWIQEPKLMEVQR